MEHHRPHHMLTEEEIAKLAREMSLAPETLERLRPNEQLDDENTDHPSPPKEPVAPPS